MTEPRKPEDVLLTQGDVTQEVEVAYVHLNGDIHTWGIIPPPFYNLDLPYELYIGMLPAKTAIIMPGVYAMSGLVEIEADSSPTEQQPGIGGMDPQEIDPEVEAQVQATIEAEQQNTEE